MLDFLLLSVSNHLNFFHKKILPCSGFSFSFIFSSLRQQNMNLLDQSENTKVTVTLLHQFSPFHYFKASVPPYTNHLKKLKHQKKKKKLFLADSLINWDIKINRDNSQTLPITIIHQTLYLYLYGKFTISIKPMPDISNINSYTCMDDIDTYVYA